MTNKKLSHHGPIVRTYRNFTTVASMARTADLRLPLGLRRFRRIWTFASGWHELSIWRFAGVEYEGREGKRAHGYNDWDGGEINEGGMGKVPPEIR